ncbi:MAG: DUF2214 family protein [Bacteroidales bacterium]|nr:DUF2214 family protein [Bacteroidales bacterium]
MTIVIPYLHFLSIMVLMGGLIAEHLILKPKLTNQQVKTLATVDLIYGIAAVMVLVTGLLRWFVWGKGADYYLSNPFFHTKVTLFIIVGIISIWPTILFLKWRKSVKKGETPLIEEKKVKRTLMLIRIQLLLVALIPLLAVMVARGYGT